MPVPDAYAGLWSADRSAQHAAFTELFDAAEQPVDWAYSVWGDVVAHLESPDNHERSIAAQLLCRLAASDPDERLRADLPRLLAVTRDERFVTARHALQSLWRIGSLGGWKRDAILEYLESRFETCAGEQNCTLVRYDIVVALTQISAASGDETPLQLAARLVLSEPDAKYRKKYESALRKSQKPVRESTRSEAERNSSHGDVLRPIASLISKSEKAQQKLAPGTWQHSMLRDNIRALNIAVALMSGGAPAAAEFDSDALREALRAVRSMAARTDEALARFTPGTSQHTLLRNRLNSLRTAEELIVRKSDER